MATDGMCRRWRRRRCTPRLIDISAISRRSLLMRDRSRRRSVSILVSPGPRVPMPPPPATRPPACRASDSPQPRSRGIRYSSWASTTCALPSLLRACWAKMSRMSAVRSTTFTLTTPSSRRSWLGVSSPSQMTVSAPAPATSAASSEALPAPMYEASQHERSRGLGEPGQFTQRVLGAAQLAFRPNANQDHPLQPQRPVLHLGDVLELSGQPCHSAQGMPFSQIQVPPAFREVPGWRIAVLRAEGADVTEGGRCHSCLGSLSWPECHARRGRQRAAGMYSVNRVTSLKFPHFNKHRDGAGCAPERPCR